MGNDSKPKIALVTHAFNSIDFDVHFNQVYAISHWVNKYDMFFIGRKGLNAADARNIITKQAIEKGCEHMFILDADHLITPNTLPLLMENKDEAIISGLVCKRLHPYPQVAWLKENDGHYIEFTLPLDGTIAEVAICAFGCTLINLKKLQELEEPYFRDTCRKTANGNMKNFRSDINVCEDFRDKGYKVWVDTRVLIGHMGAKKIIYPQNSGYYERSDDLADEFVNLREGMTGDHAGMGGLTR